MMKVPADLLRRLDAIARERSSGAGPAHDHAHVRRVTALARRIGEAEGADLDVVVCAATLHELFNYPKGHPESRRSGEVCAEHAAEVLRAEGVTGAIVERVAYAIRVHPFSMGAVAETLEAEVLQDADRLDAIGAIGVARCFATCGEMGRPLLAVEDPFCARRAPDDKAWGVDHFYAKLLSVPQRLNTESAKAIAAARVSFMKTFLATLASEIDA